MGDHDFCRTLLKITRQELTAEQRLRLKGAWSYVYRDLGDGEFHVPKDDFYWHGTADCAYDARAKGISAWLQRYYPEQEGNQNGTA